MFPASGGSYLAAVPRKRLPPLGAILLLAAALPAADTTPGMGSFRPPAGWRAAAPGLYTAQAGGAEWRLAWSVAEAAPAQEVERLRHAWMRMLEVASWLDDDDVPLGGRVWRRLRAIVRPPGEPLECTAWIGQVGGRTVLLILTHPAAAGDSARLARLEDALAALP